MAKRAAFQRKDNIVVVSPPAPAPIRRRASRRRASPVRRARRSRGRSASVGGLKPRMLGAAGGGFGVGFIEKNFGDRIPSLPMIGRKGAIAMGIYFWNPSSRIAQDIGVAAAAIAGYEFGKTGTISGEDYEILDGDDDDDVIVTT